jgi:cobalt-zinc-cadmium efflux system outer membrane protein
LATALAFWVAVPAAVAQTPSSIRQGFDAAWARHPEQRAAPLRREAAAAGVAASERWTPEPPSLEASARTDRLTRNDGVREFDAAIAVPLWLPGERSRAQAAASSEVSAVDARLLAAQWRLAAEVREIYWAHQRSRLEHELAQQRLLSAQQVAADVARRVEAGDLARADGHQAASAVAAAQSASAAAAVVVTQTTQAWMALTGQPPAGTAGEQRPAADLAMPHPALNELSARDEVARRQRDLAAVQTRGTPELTIGAVRERGGLGERYGQSVVVGVRIPLGTSSTSRVRQAAAAAELVEVESQLQLQTQRVRSQIDAARASIVSLEDARTAAERRATLSREVRVFFEKSFRLGETDLPTRLRIELETFEAERQAARSRLEVDAAISQLRQALGLLPE